LCDRPSSRLYLLDFLVEQLSFCPLDIRQEVRIFPRDPRGFDIPTTNTLTLTATFVKKQR